MFQFNCSDPSRFLTPLCTSYEVSNLYPMSQKIHSAQQQLLKSQKQNVVTSSNILSQTTSTLAKAKSELVSIIFLF